MKISVKRSGGYAGVTEEAATVDTEKLTSRAAKQLEDMLQEIRFFDLPAIVSPEAVGADLFHYEIKVTKGERRHNVSFNDDGSPQVSPLRRLVDFLIQMK